MNPAHVRDQVLCYHDDYSDLFYILSAVSFSCDYLRLHIVTYHIGTTSGISVI